MARTTFESPRWQSPLLLALGIGAFGVAWWARTEEPAWTWIFFLGFGVLGLVASAESATSWIRLEPDRLRFRASFRTTTIERRDVEKVTWEKGAGVSLRLANGSWVSLPPLADSQGLSNSIRAWIRRKGPGPES